MTGWEITLVIAGPTIGATLGAYLSSYFSKRGEQQALLETVGSLVREQVGATESQKFVSQKQPEVLSALRDRTDKAMMHMRQFLHADGLGTDEQVKALDSLFAAFNRSPEEALYVPTDLAAELERFQLELFKILKDLMKAGRTEGLSADEMRTQGLVVREMKKAHLARLFLDGDLSKQFQQFEEKVRQLLGVDP